MIEMITMVLACMAVTMFLIYTFAGPHAPSHREEADQKCPSCGTWQADCGGWAWVGNTENPQIDFAAECGACEFVSCWVWIGPGVCATYEEIEKQKADK